LVNAPRQPPQPAQTRPGDPRPRPVPAVPVTPSPPWPARAPRPAATRPQPGSGRVPARQMRKFCPSVTTRPQEFPNPPRPRPAAGHQTAPDLVTQRYQRRRGPAAPVAGV